MKRVERAPVIGVDFDNTIAGYDELMHAIALERGLIAPGVARSKKAIRDAIRALPDGETHWRGLQVTAYGPQMKQARLIDGVREFFESCRRLAVPVYIVSHKTVYANFGEANVNLRTAALAWLDDQGFFDPRGIALDKADVYFESTRDEKIERICRLGVSDFVDDLDETFLEASFPPDVRKILFATDGRTLNVAGLVAFRTWQEIRAYLLDAQHPAQQAAHDGL